MQEEKPTRQRICKKKLTNETKEFDLTYKTNTANNDAESRTTRDSIQVTDEGSKALDQFGIAVSEIVKFAGLFPEYTKH